MLTLMVIINIGSNSRSNGGSGSTSMMIMVKRTLTAVPMTSGIGKKMPSVV